MPGISEVVPVSVEFHERDLKFMCRAEIHGGVD